MRKIFILILILFVFLFGLSIGGSFNKSSSKLFEEAKEQFESEIINPENNYSNSPLVPNNNIVNIIAKKAENLIDGVIDKIFSFLS